MLQQRRVGTEEGRPPAVSCTSLRSKQGPPRGLAALGIPADFNYTTINQCSQDFGGHKKQVTDDVCLCSSSVTPPFPAASATSSLSSSFPRPWLCPLGGDMSPKAPSLQALGVHSKSFPKHLLCLPSARPRRGRSRHAPSTVLEPQPPPKHPQRGNRAPRPLHSTHRPLPQAPHAATSPHHPEPHSVPRRGCPTPVPRSLRRQSGPGAGPCLTPQRHREEPCKCLQPPRRAPSGPTACAPSPHSASGGNLSPAPQGHPPPPSDRAHPGTPAPHRRSPTSASPAARSSAAQPGPVRSGPVRPRCCCCCRCCRRCRSQRGPTRPRPAPANANGAAGGTAACRAGAAGRDRPRPGKPRLESPFRLTTGVPSPGAGSVGSRVPAILGQR